LRRTSSPTPITLARLFTEARTYRSWTAQPVGDETLRQLWEAMKFGPTANNSCPLRIRFVRSADAKARLVPLMSEGNREKTAQAPVTAILGMDLAFYELYPTLAPHIADPAGAYRDHPERAQADAMRNSSLQGGYFILAARALGLDCGPMGGFDAAAVDAAFWAGTAVKTNFICNLGHGDATSLRPRGARPDFDTACTLL
jgi:3-hydroxypropanoate dehydrogenase